MHDCRKTNMKMMDLVFGELGPRQQQEVLAEVGNCPSCSQEHRSILATLHVFDQTVDAAMPEESYWTGYEARLRARLTGPVAPKRREFLAGWGTGLFAKPAISFAIVAGLILIAAVSAIWVSRQRASHSQALAVKKTPTPQPASIGRMPERTEPPQTEIQSGQQLKVAANPRQLRVRRQIRPDVKPTMSAPEDLIATNSPSQESMRAFSPDVSPVTAPASHLEKAQLLLRSFRNARTAGKGSAIDLAYEKREAGKLIYDNILLRREAEAKRNLPVEEALNSLEPLLLDIANLPDKPSRDEVQVIRERIQKQEIIATLQIVSTGTERFGPPALLNP